MGRFYTSVEQTDIYYTQHLLGRINPVYSNVPRGIFYASRWTPYL